MEILFKASLFTGTILLLGAGVFVRCIAPPGLAAASRRRVTLGLVIGLVLLLVGSLGEVALVTLRVTRGRFDGGVYLDYLLSTRHGISTLVRCGLGVSLTLWGGRTLFSWRVSHFLWGVTGLALLGTISWMSHSGVMGLWPFLGDLMHLVAATLWGGAVLYLAWSALWQGDLNHLRHATRRVSATGLLSVLLLSATGFYLGVLHLYGLRALTTTTYGASLLVKLGIIVIILTIAGLNRWRLVPLLERHGTSAPLKRAVRFESLLLLAVLVTTSVLSTREPPHEHLDHDHAEHTPHHEAHGPASRSRTPFPGTLEPVAARRYRLVLEPDRDLARLILRDPAGATYPVEVHAAPHLVLPAQETGIWHLEGMMGDEPFSLPFTLMSARTAAGRSLRVHLTPTPALSGGGISDLVVVTDAEPAEALAVTYHMPGMQHATDDQRIPLAQTPDGLWRTTLRFPMAGTWQLTLHAGADTLELPVQVLNE